MNLNGRSAIVTGGAGGLGGATVRHLVDLGAGVVIFDRDADRGKELASELGDAAVDARGDVNDDEDVLAAIAAAVSLGTIITNSYLNGENIRLDGALRFPPK